MKTVARILTALIISTILYTPRVSGQCSGGTDDGSISPTNTWQSRIMNTSAGKKYVTFSATSGSSYIFSTNSAVGGSEPGNGQFTILDNSGNAAGGVYTTSFSDASSSSGETMIWAPSSSATYRVLYTVYGTGNCQDPAQNITLAFVTFPATQNFAVWTGLESYGESTSNNWLIRAASGYPTTGLPTSSHDVFIPGLGTATRYPIQNNTESVSTNNLTIYSGGIYQLDNTTSGFLNIYGTLDCNGNLKHNGRQPIFLLGSGKEIKGTGNLYYGTISTFKIGRYDTDAGGTVVAGYTIKNNFKVTHIIIARDHNNISSLTIDAGVTLSTAYLFQDGNLTLNGTLEIAGPASTTTWPNSAYDGGSNANPFFYTSSTLTHGASSKVYYNSGAYTTNAGSYLGEEFFEAKNQTAQSITYKHLSIRTNNGKTVTLGTGATVSVTGDLEIIGGTSGGTCATNDPVTITGNLNVGASANNTIFTVNSGDLVTLTGNFNLGSSSNNVTLNLAEQITKSVAGNGFTMADNDGHAINVTYAHATNFALANYSSALTFYGTVTYNSNSGQRVMNNTYKHLQISGSGTRILSANTTINGNLTLNDGTLDVVSGSNYSIDIKGHWYNSSTCSFTPQLGTVTFSGTGTQNVNVLPSTTTPRDNNFSFYNVVINGSDVRFYYNTANIRKIDVNQLQINAGKKLSTYNN